MKPDYWKHLAGTVCRVPVEPAPEMPFGFDTRVIADWQAQREVEEAVPWAWLLRGALVCASLIMLLSLAMNFQSLKEGDPGMVAIADSAIRMSLYP
jgi:hypothetical protein